MLVLFGLWFWLVLYRFIRFLSGRFFGRVSGLALYTAAKSDGGVRAQHDLVGGIGDSSGFFSSNPFDVVSGQFALAHVFVNVRGADVRGRQPKLRQQLQTARGTRPQH